MVVIMDGYYPITTPKKKISLAGVAGEWWIIDGSIESADMKRGDAGHEVIVIDHVRSDYGYYDTSQPWDDFIMKRGRECRSQ